jgi:hypothetical protein
VRCAWRYIRHQNDSAEVSLLIKVITLICDAPANLIDKFLPRHAELIEEGRQLRARLPAYLEQRSASLTSHCPLPAVLQSVVAAYAEPTRADVWDSMLL